MTEFHSYTEEPCLPRTLEAEGACNISLSSIEKQQILSFQATALERNAVGL